MGQVRERRRDWFDSDAERKTPRALLESLVIRLLNGWPGEGPIALASDRQLYEAALRKLAPEFSLENRSIDGLQAAFEYAVGRESHVVAMLKAEQQRSTFDPPAPSKPAQQPEGDPPRADATDVRLGYAPGTSARLDELEQQRRDAWKKPRTSPKPVARGTLASDVDARIAELEDKRRNAWKGPAA